MDLSGVSVGPLYVVCGTVSAVLRRHGVERCLLASAGAKLHGSVWALMRAAHIALTAAHRARLTSTHRNFVRYYVHLGCLTVSKGISRHRRRRALDAIDSAAAALGSTTTAQSLPPPAHIDCTNSVSRLRSSPPVGIDGRLV